MVILANSKIFGDYQTIIPEEFRKRFNIDENSILEWGISEKGEPTINFRRKIDFRDLVGAFHLDEETNSLDLKRSLICNK